MKLDQLKHQKILILGFGREGVSILNYLTKAFPEQKFAIADQNLPEQMSDEAKTALSVHPQLQTFFGPDYLAHLTDFQIVIKAPGITPHLAEIEQAKLAGVVFTSATNLFFSQCQAKIIGVTGTKGKSTTAGLIYEILQADQRKSVVLGNIGKPALDYLDQIDDQTLVVFELSSHQLMDLTTSPQIAVWLNIYPEHLDYYQDFAEYVKSKAQISKFQQAEDLFIYNCSFPEIVKVANQSPAGTKVAIAEEKIQADQRAFWDQGRLIYQNGQITEEVLSEADLAGKKLNQLSVLAAATVGRILEIPAWKIIQAIESFAPLPHRLEPIGTFKEITFYNDSLATIPQATISALNSLGSQVETLLIGGFDRGVDQSSLGEAIKNSQIKNLILFPTTGEKVWQAVVQSIPDQNLRPAHFEVSTMEEAVQKAYQLTSPGKICLLSPAATSFGLFKDYADRGDQFKENVKKYGQG